MTQTESTGMGSGKSGAEGQGANWGKHGNGSSLLKLCPWGQSKCETNPSFNRIPDFHTPMEASVPGTCKPWMSSTQADLMSSKTKTNL